MNKLYGAVFVKCNCYHVDSQIHQKHVKKPNQLQVTIKTYRMKLVQIPVKFSLSQRKSVTLTCRITPLLSKNLTAALVPIFTLLGR